MRVLLTRCLGGEQAALSELVHRYRERVVSFCFRWLGQRQDAEDAAQETLIRVCRHLPRWDATREFEPWLLAIAGNRCRTALAARRRRPTPQPLPEVANDEHRQAQAHAQLVEEVRAALSGLRSDHRQAFLLFHEQHLGYAEIAERLGVPVGTAKTWVHRARRELMQCMLERQQSEQVVQAERGERAGASHEV